MQSSTNHTFNININDMNTSSQGGGFLQNNMFVPQHTPNDTTNHITTRSPGESELSFDERELPTNNSTSSPSQYQQQQQQQERSSHPFQNFLLQQQQLQKQQQQQQQTSSSQKNTNNNNNNNFFKKLMNNHGVNRTKKQNDFVMTPTNSENNMIIFDQN